MKISKILFLTFWVVFTLTSGVFGQVPANIVLPAPDKTGGKPLMQALNDRSSAREFSEKELSLQQLSDLLWSADGINRPESGKRTAPTARNYQDMSIYVFMRAGIYLYEPKAHTLIQVKAGNFLKATGTQDFVEKAALNLVYVSDLSKMGNTSDEHKPLYAGIHTGCIVQNVYLYCASQGLNTVTRASFSTNELSGLLNTGPDKLIVLAQTVGFKP
jgi:SagB-type dehydrogenase family enzyme